MTSLLGVRKRAEEFADAVDGSSSSSRPEVVDLLALVTALRQQDDVRPSEEFSTTLRTRLLAEAEQQQHPAHASLVLPPRPRGARERRLVAAASAVVLIGGSAGMAAAAQDALPGQALYPIKRGIEHAQTGLSFSAADKGHRLLHQADDRLVEAQALLDDSASYRSPQLPETISDFTSQAEEGSTLLLDSFEEHGDEHTVAAVHEFVASGLAALADLAADAPESAQAQLRDAALALSGIDRAAAKACSSCTAGDLQLPAIFLVSAEVDRAITKLHSATKAPDNSHPVRVDGSLVEEAVKHGLHSTGKKAGGTTGGGTGSPAADEKAPGTTGGATGRPRSSVPGTTPGANPTGPGLTPQAPAGLPTSGVDVTGNLPGDLLDGLGDTLGDTLGGLAGGQGDEAAPSAPSAPSSSSAPRSSSGPGGVLGDVVGTLLPQLGLPHP